MNFFYKGEFITRAAGMELKMGKIVVLAEKPSVGREIARVLKCTRKNPGYIEGNKYIITWSLGHLVTLADPEKYGKNYERWNIEDLPILPDKMKLEVIKETGKQFQVVKKLLLSPATESLIIATDAGREGELVARWIMEKAGYKKPVKRLWISSQTDKAILEGFSKIKDGAEYYNLYQSGKCRAEADWLVGLNVSRALACKHNARLSAGRVQTPTLAMVVQREEEIKKFVPKEFYTIEAKTKDFILRWKDVKTGEARIFNKEKAEKILEKIEKKNGKVIDVKIEKKKEPMPQLYDLTELQRDANKKYKYSAKRTLGIIQALYEKHKIVTYPRTDSKYLSDDIVPTFPERLRAVSVGPYATFARMALKKSYQKDKRFIDNSKVSDHHAIIPTEQTVNLAALEQEEKNIFDLIVKRFLAMFQKPYEYERTTVTCEVEGELFYARGKRIIDLGYREIYQGISQDDEGDDEDQSMPGVKKGDGVFVEKAKVCADKTKPPARYTEATLLSAMENAGKFIEDSTLKSALDGALGLGTSATRADIIEKLADSFCIDRVNNEIIPTKKAMQLVEIVPPDLKSPELTAKWEQQLLKISKGQYKSSEFIRQMREYAASLVQNVVHSARTYKHENITTQMCPECGKNLLDVNGKKGKLLVCIDRECGYRRNISQTTNMRCPNCRKNLELAGEGEKRIYRCICGFREKADKMKKGPDVSKREVENYMKSQKGEEKEFKNFALAEALQKAFESKNDKG